MQRSLWSAFRKPWFSHTFSVIRQYQNYWKCMEISRWYCKTPYSKGARCIRLIVLQNKKTQKCEFVTNLFSRKFFNRWNALFIVIYHFWILSSKWEPKQVILRAYFMYSYSGIRSSLTFTVHMVWKRISKISPGSTNHNTLIFAFWWFLQG